ncbi:MAG: N-acetylglucosamine kinase [Bacteroidota bacterium]|nr:N-acetylglucosamine kinase [Bacteroidota bacterium]
MLLIADSGSTKIDWCLIDNNGKKTYFHTIGMNPYNVSKGTIIQEIETHILPYIPQNEKMQMFFYGSGCSTQQKKIFMKDIFLQYIPKADIHIEDDLLGAARSTCGREAGVVAILGTGSNSCLYDGKKIVENLPSLGYVLCDEGAGTNIGKIVLRNYLRGQMPNHIHQQFAKEYKGEEADFLTNLYQGEKPNFYLASFAKFAISRQENDYCRNIIAEAFHNFFLMQVTQYSNYKKYPINVVGSVGYYAQEVLKQVAKQYDIKVGKIIQAPLEELINYHLQTSSKR